MKEPEVRIRMSWAEIEEIEAWCKEAGMCRQRFLANLVRQALRKRRNGVSMRKLRQRRKTET